MRREFVDQNDQNAKIRVVTMALLVLLVSCLLGGCGSAKVDGNDGSTQSSDETDARTGSRKEERKMDVADDLSIEHVKDEEFVVMRVGEDYVLLPGGSRQVFLGDCAGDVQMEDGQILRIVADGEIYNGGVAGYMRDVFLEKVKETENLTYQEAIDTMEFPGTEGARFWWGELVVKYCEGDHVFLVALNRIYVNVYLDGELALQYEYDEKEGILTPFYNYLETCTGDVEFSE